jgi:uroporphyrinogen decarboxylase
VVDGLVKAAKHEALILMTLYSPFMCAVHTAGAEVLTHHIEADPDAVCKGMDIITESLMVFVRGCIERGVDGFYHSTQGGETGRFSETSLFERCVKPYDLALMHEIAQKCIFNILHVCDYQGPYDDLAPFLDYPGHVVNCPHLLGGQTLTPAEVARLFGRPAMGGLDRHGFLAHGSEHEIRREVKAVLGAAPGRFILGADCTVPGDTPWDNLKLAIDTAQNYLR